MTGALEDFEEAVRRGDHRAALKILDRALRDAKGRNDARELEAVGARASNLHPSLSGREQEECDRLLYAVNQNLAFLDRKARLSGTTTRPAPAPIVAKVGRAGSAQPRDAGGASRVEAPVPETPLGRLDHAWRTYAGCAKGARAELNAAQTAYRRRVQTGQKQLASVVTAPKLAGSWFTPGDLSKVVVYEDRVRLAEGEFPLTAEVQATVDTAGSLMVTRRHTLTRAALLGPFAQFAPKAVKHGDNELYLLVEAPDWASVVKCDPKSGEDARKMAQAINLAARGAAEAAARRKILIAEARAALEAISSDDSDITEARRRLEEVKAEGELSLTRAYAGVQEELRDAEEDRTAKRAEKRLSKIRGQAEKLGREIEADLAQTSPRIEISPARDPGIGPADIEPEGPAPSSGLDPSPVSARADSGPATTAADPLVLLERLAALRDSGVLTSEEFEAKKAEILRRI